jgi:hypothetical protein
MGEVVEGADFRSGEDFVYAGVRRKVILRVAAFWNSAIVVETAVGRSVLVGIFPRVADDYRIRWDAGFFDKNGSGTIDAEVLVKDGSKLSVALDDQPFGEEVEVSIFQFDIGYGDIGSKKFYRFMVGGYSPYWYAGDEASCTCVVLVIIGPLGMKILPGPVCAKQLVEIAKKFSIDLVDMVVEFVIDLYE